jgi:PKD repeat protein
MSDSLEMEEGIKYSYSYETPLASLSIETDIFVTVSNEDFWEGIVVVSTDMEDDKYDSTRVYRFKISKDNYDFYETEYLRQKTIDSDDVEFNKLTSEGSQTGLSSYLVFLLLQNLYDFDMDSLIEDKTVNDITFGGAESHMTLEGPVEYNNYNCFKITVTSDMIYASSTTTYYVSSVFPYLLVSYNSKVGDINNYAYSTLDSVEQGTFSFDDYDIDEAPNSQPRAIMNYTINDLTVDFDASESYDSDGSIVSYEWDFGDGTNVTEISVQHTYAESKRYTVKLYVWDDEGEKSTDMEFIDIGDEDSNDIDEGSQDETTKTPGFELIFVMIAIALLLFFKRRT